jgi:segregation and condensation protein A
LVSSTGDPGDESFSVKLEPFEGPLDLLLFLVRKNELDIYDIPIARVTGQYLEYLDLIRALNLDQAGDFLAMAATLVHIKSRMLLPEPSGPEEEADDPREELIQPLLEYARLKEAAMLLEKRHMLDRDVFTRDFLSDELLEPEENDLVRVSLFDLLSAFKEVIAHSGVNVLFALDPSECTLEDKVSDILERLSRSKSLLFTQLFSDLHRRELVVTFLAVLELLKLNLIQVVQPAQGGMIRVFLAPQTSSAFESHESSA